MANIALFSGLKQSSVGALVSKSTYATCGISPYTLDFPQMLSSFAYWDCKRIQDDGYNFQNVNQISYFCQNILNKNNIAMLSCV